MATDSKFNISLTDASDALYDFSCSPCSDDGKNAEGVYQCVVCQMFYCQRCVVTHNKFTKNHNILDKNSAKFGQAQTQKEVPSSIDLPTEVCVEHHDELMKMFCGQHDVVCCTVCIAAKHRSCMGVEYIPNIAKRLLQGHSREKTKSSLEKVKDDLQNLKSKMQTELKSVNQERDDIVTAFQQFKRRCITRVEEVEKQSLKELQTKHKAISEEIEAYEKKINDMLKTVELRLDKLKQNDNDAQAFVDIKYAEQTSTLGNECVVKSTKRNVEHMTFDFNTGLETCLNRMTSLGILKVSDIIAGQAHVNILPYLDDRNSDRIKKFTTFLQEKLRESFLIESNCIQREEITADRYTLFIFEENAFDHVSNEDGVIANIARKYDHMTILLILKPKGHAVLQHSHRREFKASFHVQYEFYKRDVSFGVKENQQVYEAVSEIIKTDERIN